MEELFTKKFVCQLCAQPFTSSRVRRSMMRLEHTDYDFCPRYSGPNPIDYKVLVCPHCGYSFVEAFGSLREHDKEKLLKKILPPLDNLGGPRTPQQVVETYRRALRCALLKEEREIIIAELYLHLAWVYRFQEETENEKECLQNALHYYEQAYINDKKITAVAKVLFLIAELNYRLGKPHQAVNNFARVATDPTFGEPALARMARERWQQIRQDYKESDDVASGGQPE